MNLNQSLVNRKKIQTNKNGISAFKQIMGPPSRPAPKRKSTSTPSSGTNWGRNYHSILNNSTVMRSGSTTTSTALENESRVIMALTEGRGEARCEVGLASIDLSLPNLILCQISDTQSYINTLTKINILNPTDIIVPSTFLESLNNRLVDKLKKQFPKIKILNAPRKTFNKSNGMDRILQLCLPSINTICVGLQHKYYALAAASALITYLQNNLNIYFANESINVVYQESEGYAVIDVSTADRLELVSSTKPNQATRYSTLFGVLNYCYTRIGARTLRSIILQPPCSPHIIEKTSQCVGELIKRPQVLLSIQAILQKIPSIDQLLTITTMTFGTDDNCSAKHLNYLLLLNSLIDLIDPLKDIIENCQQPFFKELKSTLQSEHFVTIKKELRTMIHPSAQFAKREGGITQRCFAIKSGINGLLDLVRKTYSERLNDMTEYVRYLGNKYNLPLTLGNNNTKGYHIVLKLNSQQKRFFKKSDLPPEFIQVYRLSGSCTMKTAELINYSTRLEDIMMEILKISNAMIHKTVSELKQYISFFYKLCEDIAHLDILQSLTEASRRGNYVRPKFGEFTELSQARHPMLELLIGDQRVANPISFCKDFNVQIITGPNGSGKSIYIRQVMLLQIMAQIGCYVPAESALFRPINRMFARIYLEDNMENGASAFILEMKEVKYMMTLLSENSLFIIDELCRSTSADEGTALAMAILEEFCRSPGFVYVTTHYTTLANLSQMYLNVKTWQMETIASGDNPQDLNLNFKFKLIPGVTQLKHYGVYIVKNIWPPAILDEVYRVLNSLKSTSRKKRFVGIDDKLRLKYKLESDLRKLKSRKKLTAAEINKLLNDYQNELRKIGIFINLSLNYQENDMIINGGNLGSTSGLVPYGNSPAGAQNFSFSDQTVLDDRIEDIPTPESLRQDYVLETSSYKNLSNFLREDSDNIDKMYPEVTIKSYDNVFNPKSDLTFTLVENNVDQSKNRSQSFQMQEELMDNEVEQSKEQEQAELNDTNKVGKTESASTPTLWRIENFSNCTENIDLESIMEDLESFNESFFDEDFDYSESDSYKSGVSDVISERQHINPVVTIINGPDWVSCASSEYNTAEDEIKEDNVEENLSQFSESINYSPLCSPSLNQNIEDEKSIETNNKSESNMTSFAKNDGVSTNGTSDTNLEDISLKRALDNVTIENLKSITTDDKPSSKSGSNEDAALKVTSSSSMKESDKSNDNDTKKKIKTKKRSLRKIASSQDSKTKVSKNKFIPPKKLTKKEIEEEFNEQDRKLYETDISESNFSKYLSQILKRPSVKQVQESKHLAFVRRTEEGVEVISAEPEPTKKKKFPFKRNISTNSNVDVSIFSDRNAKCFDDFLNSNERDVKRFKFNLDPSSERDTSVKTQQFNFNPQSISDYAIGNNVNFSFRSKEENHLFSQTLCDKFQSLTPDGYYKENKEDINNIINKYVNENVNELPEIAKRLCRNDTSVFETDSFNGDYLDL